MSLFRVVKKTPYHYDLFLGEKKSFMISGKEKDLESLFTDGDFISFVKPFAEAEVPLPDLEDWIRNQSPLSLHEVGASYGTAEAAKRINELLAAGKIWLETDELGEQWLKLRSGKSA